MRRGWCAIAPGRVGAWKRRRVRRLAAAPLATTKTPPAPDLHTDGKYAILGLDVSAHARVMLAAERGLGIHELWDSRVARDKAQWAPLLDWLEQGAQAPARAITA